MNEDGGTARVMLDGVQEARRALERQRERVEELRGRCARMTARLDGMPRGGGGQGPEGLWAVLVDESELAGQMEADALRRRREAERAIGRVKDPAGQAVLRLRYLEGLSWPVIQRELERRGLGRSIRGVYRLHSRALEEVCAREQGTGAQLSREREDDPQRRNAG